jgi:hypothetical protein
VVRRGLDRASPWYPFVENWAGEAFARYVAFLEMRLDALASVASPAERARMSELFELTVRYEIAFWEMAATGEGWPGLEAWQPVVKPRRHSAGDASRLAALLLPYISPICAVVAPCPPGASPASVRRRGSTTGC